MGRPKRYRWLVVLLALVAYLALGSQDGSAVLCFGADGHVRIETPGAGCGHHQADRMAPHDPHQADLHPRAPACTDVALCSGLVSLPAPAPSLEAVAVWYPRPVGPAPWEARARAPRQPDRSRSGPPDPLQPELVLNC